LGLHGKFYHIKGCELYIINAFYILLAILTFKILIQGLNRFNKYGLGKAAINLSPFFLIGLCLYIFVLLR
jgi:hypothetical protein